MYNTGKAALSAFAASIAVEGAMYDVDVLAVHPGPITTPLGRAAADLEASKNVLLFAFVFSMSSLC